MPESFIYANGRISAKENSLLDRRMWQMLLAARNEDEVLRLLGDTWYGGFMQHHSMEDCFLQAMETTEEELLELSEDERLIRGILHRRDVRNARYIWKSMLSDDEISERIILENPGLVDLEVLRKAPLSVQTRDELPVLFRETLEDLMENQLKGTDLDRRMDLLASRVETEELPQIGSGFSTFVKTRLEQKNFLTAGRCKISGLGRQDMMDMILPGGYHTAEDIAESYKRNNLDDLLAETPGFESLARAFSEALEAGSFFAFEREGDRQLLELLEKGAFPVFGPSPLAAFVIRREMEIGHLRLLIAAKSAGVDDRRLKERLPRG